MTRKPLFTRIVGLVGGLTLLATAVAPVSADDEDAPASPPTATATATAEPSTEAVQDVDPEAEHDGRPAGYYLGRTEDGGFRLRSHGPNVRHHFTAVLRTDGRFVDVETVRLEAGDDVEQLFGLCKRQARGWLVEDDDVRFCAERKRDKDALLLSAGQFVEWLIRELVKFEVFERAC